MRLLRGAVHIVLFALVCALASCDTGGNQVLSVVACDPNGLITQGTPFEAADVGVFFETGGDPLLAPVTADLSSYLTAMWGSSFQTTNSAPTFSNALTIWISTSAAARAQANFTHTDGYSIVRQDPPGGTVVLVVANDSKDLAFGTYALLEELGARFFHPQEEVVPQLGHPWVPTGIQITRAPAMVQRGLQLHTLHPIEYFHILNEPSPAHFADAQRFIDWLVKTGQNYFQWVELATVDFATWQPYAQSIVDYAHSRGVRVGACVQMWGGAALQNNFVLVTDANNWQAEMSAQLTTILGIDWDVLELALGEFVSADPQSIIDWLNYAVAYVNVAAPNVEVNAQNHVGNYANLYVQYMGQTVYYYHLPGFALPSLGQEVHTLSLFDLYRDWGTYKHPNFFFQHDYILQQLPTRRVSYFPESAYWISADIDVPLFLPETIYARWNDIHTLTAELASDSLPPLEGHLTFVSGHEWNYWLTDYLTAKMLWEPTQPLTYFMNAYTDAFGSCGASIDSALESFTDLQTQYVFDQRLFAYLQGENGTVDEGYLLGYETHPQRIAFEDVLAMSPGDQQAFQENVVSQLEAMADAEQPLVESVGAQCRGSTGEAASFCNELYDGMNITVLRARHSIALYTAMLDLASGNDTSADIRNAQQYTSLASAVIARREPHYRFDLQDLTGAYTNATIYAFGYLRQAHTLCYWTRQEIQATTLIQTGSAATISDLPSCND